MWNLQLLGGVRLASPDGTAVARLGARTEAMLAYLGARPGQPTPRRLLIDLVWSDRAGDDARNAFRQWLFDFRRRCGGARLLQVDGEALRLDENVCRVDVAEFLQLARSDEPAARRAACALFAGDFAKHLDGGTGLVHWLAGQREQVRGCARQLLARMQAEADDRDALAAASRLAHALIASDPIDEAAYRSLMALQLAAGQRAKALETWMACRRALMAENGAHPSGETLALYQRIQGDRAAAPPATAHVPHLHLVDAAAAQGGPGGEEARLVADDDMQRGWMYFGNICCEGDIARARTAFESAAALCPDAPAPRLMLARTHLSDFMYGWNGNPMCHYRTAAAIAGVLRRKHPGDFMVRAFGARIQLWRGAYAKAIEEAKAAAANCETAYTLSCLGDALMFAGRHDEAVAVMRSARDANPGDRANFRTTEGMALFALGELDEALRVLSSAVRRHPPHCMAWASLAAVHAELGDLDAARAAVIAAKSSNRRLSVAFARDGLPVADPEVRRRWARAWAAAGMPQQPGTLHAAAPAWIAPGVAARHPIFDAIAPVR